MNWNDLATTKLNDIERPPQAPNGHYIATFRGEKAECGESKTKGTPQAKVPIRIVEALDDVDAGELENFTSTTQLPFNASTMFYFTPNTNWRFQEFVEGLGVSADFSIPEAIEAMVSIEEPFVVEAKLNTNPNNPDDTGVVRFENPVPLSAWRERQARSQGG